MTKAEKKAMEAYKKEIIKQGIDKDMAETLAKTMIEYKIVLPVVNEG